MAPGPLILVFPVERRFRHEPSFRGPGESINRSTFSNLLCSLSLLRARGAPPPRCGRLQARRRTDPLTTISPFAIDLRAPFAARLEARAPRRRCALTPKSGQLMPAQRPTDACGARGRQICSQHYLHLPSTGALLSPRALTRSRCGGDELGLHAGPVRARTAALQGRMPRARAHAAARIDGAECSRALQVRRRWRRRIAPRTQPAPNVVPRPAA